MIRYSVIMPIFNAIQFIEKNLKMFQNLNRNDIELIVINDGSKDGSKEVVKTYQKNIKNLVLINQENRGVSYARNVGLQNAQGKYVTFLDCDDSIDGNLFDTMDAIYHEEYDLIRYGINIISKNRETKQKLVEEKVIYKDFYKNKEIYKLIYTTNKMNSASNQIIRTQILKEHKIFFDVNHKYAEDFEFNRKLAKYIKTACFLPDCFYNYNMYENSISRTEKKDSIMKCIRDSIEVHSQSYMECKQKDKELLEATFRNISLEFMTTVRRIFFIDKIKITEIDEILTELASLKNIIFLINEKKANNWKTNSFIDHCLYKKSGNIENLFYKYYFKLKKLIKDIIY